MSISGRLYHIMHDKKVNKKEVYSRIGEPPYQCRTIISCMDYVEKVFDALGVDIEVQYLDQETGEPYNFDDVFSEDDVIIEDDIDPIEDDYGYVIIED